MVKFVQFWLEMSTAAASAVELTYQVEGEPSTTSMGSSTGQPVGSGGDGQTARFGEHQLLPPVFYTHQQNAESDYNRATRMLPMPSYEHETVQRPQVNNLF